MNGSVINPEIFAADWQTFAVNEQLDETQIQQFQMYLSLLQEWNEHINLTAITKLNNIIRYHFQDSLALGHHYDMQAIHTLVDVGSGGGFPGIPLKIVYPHVQVILIEVNNKKVTFLREVIKVLGLKGIDVYTNDWRTFLRATTYTVDVFCARASLKMPELLRIFKPGCRYKNTTLVYWASRLWEPTQEEKKYVVDMRSYSIGRKRRVLVVMRNVP